MAMISPFKDYELTNSLMELSDMFRKTREEKRRLEEEIKHKVERLNAIEKRMRDIVSNEDKWKIAKNNFLTFSNHQSIVDFVERMLNTRDNEKVMNVIMHTMNITEMDSRYTKEYWENELNNGTYSVTE